MSQKQGNEIFFLTIQTGTDQHKISGRVRIFRTKNQDQQYGPNLRTQKFGPKIRTENTEQDYGP